MHTVHMSAPTPYPTPQHHQPAPYYGPPGTYSGGHFIPAKRPFSQLAIGGFLASFFGLGLLGLPMSIAGLVVTQRHPHYRGSGLAVVGIVLGVGWAIFNITFIGTMIFG